MNLVISMKMDLNTSNVTVNPFGETKSDVERLLFKYI